MDVMRSPGEHSGRVRSSIEHTIPVAGTAAISVVPAKPNEAGRDVLSRIQYGAATLTQKHAGHATKYHRDQTCLSCSAPRSDGNPAGAGAVRRPAEAGAPPSPSLGYGRR